jgi:hypothetical protein
VEPCALPGKKTARAIARDDEGEHTREGHEDEVVVAVGVAGIGAGMAVNLRHDAEAHGPCSPGGLPGGGLIGCYEPGSATAWRLVTREHDGIAASLAAKPPHQGFVPGRTGVSVPEQFLGALRDGFGHDQVAGGV